MRVRGNHAPVQGRIPFLSRRQSQSVGWGLFLPTGAQTTTTRHTHGSANIFVCVPSPGSTKFRWLHASHERVPTTPFSCRGCTRRAGAPAVTKWGNLTFLGWLLLSKPCDKSFFIVGSNNNTPFPFVNGQRWTTDEQRSGPKRDPRETAIVTRRSPLLTLL